MESRKPSIHHLSPLRVQQEREQERRRQESKMSRRDHLWCFVFLLLAVGSQAKAAKVVVSPVVAVDFVRRSCRSTSYPRVCESTLVPSASDVGRSPRRLARAALVVGADRATNCSSYLVRAGAGAGSGGMKMKDCLEMARDAEDRLRQSAAEMERMGRAGSPRFAWSLSNVQTWASAALTDTSTCLDSLGPASRDGKDDAAVRRRVVAVAQATSNALALVNKLDPQRRLLLF